MNELRTFMKLHQFGIGESVPLSILTASTFSESWKVDDNGSDIESYIVDNFEPKKLEVELKDKQIIYLGILFENMYAAYCKIEMNLQPSGYKLDTPICISRLYVKKEFQNAALGSYLINEALDIASKKNFKTIWLGVWLKNTRAILFYERLGFKKFGTTKFIMGNDISEDFLMKRSV